MKVMKIAEALTERASFKKLADSNSSRAIDCSTGPNPEVDPLDALRSALSATDSLYELVRHIHVANANTTARWEGQDWSITELLVERERLNASVKIYERIINQVRYHRTDTYEDWTDTDDQGRPRRKPIPVNVSLPDLVAARDELAKASRALDSVIQASNWSTDLY